VIRFSAALVAVAIGVLIGGIATSKLLLVYIAIVVSAVALVALAIGVVLKRGELFGEGQGLVPDGAGAAPLPQARASESGSEGQDKVPAGAHVAPPPPFQAAAGGYAAFDGTAKAASPSAGADPSAARTAAAGQGRPADRVPSWETQAARGPWSSPAPDWMPSGQDERAVSAAGGAGSRAPSAWQGPAPTGTPGGRAGGWGAPSADAQAAANVPRSWAAPSPSASPDAPAVKPGAGSGSATPSWFDRLGGQADAPPTVAAPTIASPPVPGTSGSGDATSGDDGAGDEDDDWPTRYSWLDDDTDESGEASQTVASVVADAETERKSPDAAGTTGDAGPADAGSDDIAPGDIAPDAVAPVKATAPGAPGSGTDTADAATADAGVADAAPGDPANATSAGEPGAEIIAFPRAAADTTGDADDADDSTAASETGSEPPSTAEGDAVPGADLVTVVPGVPRYHRADCVLIRFMPEGDVRKLSIAAAKDTGCTPCAACQPEG
jgi:hypothetical protein